MWRYLGMDERLLAADTIVLDVGNVLLTFDPPAVAGLLPEAYRGRLYGALFGETRLWSKFDLGAECSAAVAQEAARAAGLPEQSAWVMYLLEHFPETMLPLPLYGMIPELKALGKKLYALTNYPEPSFTLTCARFPLLDLLDGAVVSSREKTVKPDPAIYRILTARYSLSPASALFIDDTAANADAAARMGFRTWHYAGNDRIFQ